MSTKFDVDTTTQDSSDFQPSFSVKVKYAVCFWKTLSVNLSSCKRQLYFFDSSHCLWLEISVEEVVGVKMKEHTAAELMYIPDSSVNSSSARLHVSKLFLLFDSIDFAEDWANTINELVSVDVLLPLLIFVNPYGGRRAGKSLWRKQIKEMFDFANRPYAEVITAHREHITDTCRNLEISTLSGVIVIGGDGSLAEAINGLHANPAGRLLPVGVIPAGSSNALARARGICCPIRAAFFILKNKQSPLDLLLVTPGSGQPFFAVCAVSFGFIAEVNKLAETVFWRNCLGPARYGCCGARRVIFGGSICNYQAAVNSGGGREISRGSWDVFSPELWRGGEGLILVKNTCTWKLLTFLHKFNSRNFEGIRNFQVDLQTVEIEPIGSNLPFSIDGELREISSLKIELCKGHTIFFS